MRKDEYLIAKQKNPDWTSVVSRDIKVWSKMFIFDSVLVKRKQQTVMDAIGKRINEFVEVIDEPEIADGYKAELEEYAVKTYQWTYKAFGAYTPALLAIALSPKDSVNKRQIKLLTDNGGVIVGLPDMPLQPIFPPSTEQAYNRGVSAQTYFEDVQEATKKQMKEFQHLEQKPVFFANVNPRSHAEMIVRFEEYKRNKQELIDRGVRLVYVPPHANCSKRCQPYQGRVYSLDGTSGTVDGHRFIPIEDVSDNVTYTSPNTGRTYFSGLFSYNCRHRLEEYNKGQKIDKIPADVIEQQRDIEAKQRLMERDYRAISEKAGLYEILYKHSHNAEMEKIALAELQKARVLKRDYIKFSKDNKIPYFPNRLEIVSGENRYVRTYGKHDELAKQALRMKEDQENNLG